MTNLWPLNVVQRGKTFIAKKKDYSTTGTDKTGALSEEE